MNTFINTRLLKASPAEIFAAIQNPARLARWWGPNGFSNRFEVFEFQPGGRWLFDMIGPDSTVYRNESVFLGIDADRQVIIQHTCLPHFTLTLTLEAVAEGTVLHWQQVFEDAAFAESMRHFLIAANEQNLDRLNAEIGLNHP